MLIATLFAGQHTSSITSAWTGYLMLAHPDTSLAPAIAEQRRLLAERGDTLDMAALNDMPVLHAAITESLRLFPPLIMLLRLAKKPFAVTTSAGVTHVVPAGDMVFASPAFSHRLPHIFPDPAAFDPARFADGPDKAAAAGSPPFSFIGFGGGRHGCMGTNFAYLQIKAIWAVLLREFEFEMVDPLPEVGEGERRGGRALFSVFVSSPPTPPPRPLPRTARLRLARRRPQIGAGAVPAPQAGARGQVRGEGVGKRGLRGRGTARDATGERVGASATRARDRVLPWGSRGLGYGVEDGAAQHGARGVRRHCRPRRARTPSAPL